MVKGLKKKFNNWKFSSAAYRKVSGNRCPKCGSSDIEGGEVTIDSNYVSQTVGCLECNAEWEDIYRLQGYRKISAGD